jgi:hypothetical protein
MMTSFLIWVWQGPSPLTGYIDVEKFIAVDKTFMSC